jgi:hypothetical protein
MCDRGLHAAASQCPVVHLPVLQHRALRTNATTAQVLQVAVADCSYSLRPGEQPGVPQVLLQHHAIQELDALA